MSIEWRLSLGRYTAHAFEKVAAHTRVAVAGFQLNKADLNENRRLNLSE